MEARGVTDEELAEFQQLYPLAKKHTFHAPPGHEDDILDADVILVPASHNDVPSIFIPWIADAEDRLKLANGGTVWLRIIGTGMPPVAVIVTE